MVTTPNFSRPLRWTWSGARFVREKTGEVDFQNQKRSLRYKRARIYSAQLGRFISRDPRGYVDGLNLYRAYFVPGAVDPEGMFTQQADEFVARDVSCEKVCHDKKQKCVKGCGWITDVSMLQGCHEGCSRDYRDCLRKAGCEIKPPDIGIAPTAHFQVDGFVGFDCEWDLQYCYIWHFTFRFRPLNRDEFYECKEKARRKFRQGLTAGNPGATSWACKMLSRCYLLEWQ